MTKEKKQTNKDKKDNTGPLVSQDIPTKVEYLSKPIKPKRPKKSGIVLKDKYAKLIRTRKKREIISTENLGKYIGKEIFLCGKRVYGSVILNEPIKLDKVLLRNHNKRHLITEYDIDKLWPEEKTFYAYSFRITKMFKKCVKYKNTGINFGIIDNIEFENKIEISKMRDKNEISNIVKSELRELSKVMDVSESEQKIKSIKENDIKSNSYLDKYYQKFNSLKILEFGGKYKEVGILFLALYGLYLEKSNGKIYDKDGVVLKPAPDVTENYIRIRIRDPKTIVEGSFRTITISSSQGIKAVIGKLKKDPTGPTHIQSVLFDKNKWDTKRALTWVREHRENLKSLDSNEEEEKSSPKKVEVKEKVETKEIWICPHCNKEIGEKELYYNEKADEWFHRPCIEKGSIELPKDDRKLFFIEKKAENYVDSSCISRDKDKGIQEEKWIWCKNCKKEFDYYKQLIDDKSTVLCPHCGALVILEDK